MTFIKHGFCRLVFISIYHSTHYPQLLSSTQGQDLTLNLGLLHFFSLFTTREYWGETISDHKVALKDYRSHIQSILVQEHNDRSNIHKQEMVLGGDNNETAGVEHGRGNEKAISLLL